MCFVLGPEVAGGFGDLTFIDTSVFPPLVSSVELQLEGWLGDDLLETFPCFFVTEQLHDAIEAAELTGYQFNAVKVTKSELFNALYPSRNVPHFFWLRVIGDANVNDFGLSVDHRLVVSRKALDIMSGFNLQNCDISEYSK